MEKIYIRQFRGGNKLVCYCFFVLLFFNNISAFSQVDTLTWNETVKLGFSDFAIGKGISGNNVSVTLKYGYEFVPATNGKAVPIVKAASVLDRKESSLLDSSVINLRYAQIIFDLSGYNAKLLKLRAMQMDPLKCTPEELRVKMDDLFFQTNASVLQLRKKFDLDLQKEETVEVISAWENKIDSLLNSTPDVVVENQTTNWQIGLFIGVGRNILFGKTKSYFTDATGLNFGFELDVKKARFALDMNLGFNKTVKYFDRKAIWEPGTKTNLTAIEFSYGYKISKKGWIVVPYAGLSINGFTPRKVKDDDRRELNGYGPVVGIELNRIFKKQIDYQESVILFYKAKLSLSPTTFENDFAGTQINLRVSIGFDVSKTRRRMAYAK